jgi:hypothetical protein
MKKILALIGIFILSISCSPDTDEQNIRYELVPVQSIVIDDVLYVGEENIITIKYSRPNNCYGFNGFVYEKEANTRTIGVQNYVVEKSDCQPITNDLSERNLSFIPETTGTYTFKFYQGKDASGNNIYLEIQREVVVL